MQKNKIKCALSFPKYVKCAQPCYPGYNISKINPHKTVFEKNNECVVFF